MRQPVFAPAGSDVPLAPWGLRALGAVADGVILGLLTYAIALVTGVKGRYSFLYLDLGLRFAYSWALLVGWGHTLGMALVHLRAVDALEGRSPLSPGRAAIRSAMGGLLTVVPVGALIDLLWPLWDPRNQTIHDKVAGTVVLREPAPPDS